MRECLLAPDVRARWCRQDPSRGFLAAALFRRPGMRVTGFGGKGHYYDPSAPLYHNMNLEHRVLWENGVVRNRR